MLNEVKEFEDYTKAPTYTTTSLRDTAWLGRFTLEAILNFLGLDRIFTILARGYLFQSSDPYKNVELARRALLAWCSIPDERTSKDDWEYKTCFPEFHVEFPELVDADGNGWYIRHIHAIADFMEQNPSKVSAFAKKALPAMRSGFDHQWRQKVKQFQTPIFLESTDGIWTLRFDDVIANALTLGPLRKQEATLSDTQKAKIAPLLPKEVTIEHVAMLISYYEANKPEDTDWVILPAANFNCYFGNTAFSKKVLPAINGIFIERSEMSYGSSRYKVLEEYL